MVNTELFPISHLSYSSNNWPCFYELCNSVTRIKKCNMNQYIWVVFMNMNHAKTYYWLQINLKLGKSALRHCLSEQDPSFSHDMFNTR